MNETLVRAAMDWSSQKVDFEDDGSLRDIYVEDVTVEDWKVVVVQVLDGDRRGRLQRGGVVVPIPTDFEAVFGRELDGSDRHVMSFTVGEVVLDCYFFTPTEIEFSFAPNDVDETSLRNLLGFMIDVGDAIRKPVIMTPENCRQSPIFEYDSNAHRLRWIPPRDSRQ